MIVHRLRGHPEPALARSLAAFEAQFRYPLGPGRTFSIEHGEDYPRFFRAIGDAMCFAAAQDGTVRGTLGAAIRTLRFPDASQRPVLYIGDLKVASNQRRGQTLIQLLRELYDWAHPRVDAAFSVVMSGTPVSPERYSGRMGIPQMSKVGEVLILRLNTAVSVDPPQASVVTAADGLACYERLTAGHYGAFAGNCDERSRFPATWLMLADGAACGLLEDTMKAKRLFADDGTEMCSAHLSCFASASVAAGVALIQAALPRANRLGFPALFVAVPESEAADFSAQLQPAVATPATIFGIGLAPGRFWHINTAEI